MRSTRVFFLLLSVLQFIFFLKLVEYVRGAEIPSRAIDLKDGSAISEGTQEDEDSRGFFIAPKIKRKKLKPWIIGGKSTNFTDEPTPTATVKKDEGETNEVLRPQGRLCPACENNDCAIAAPIFAGFPVVPIIIAVLVGIGWFILFLIFWLFWIRPMDKDHGGYGYGSEGGYGTPSSSYGPTGDSDDDNGKPSIFGHGRSFSSYTQMMHFALNAIEKFADLYNSE